MKNSANRTRMLSVAVAAVLITVMGTTAAQSDRRSRDRAKEQVADKAPAFPEATREEPDTKTSRDSARKLQNMVDLYNEQKLDEALAVSREISASDESSNYDKAVAAQMAAQVAYANEDMEAAAENFARVVELDALDNENHYTMMLNLAQLQQHLGQLEESIATFDRFFEETGSKPAEATMLKGQALLKLGRHEEAIAAMQEAIAAAEQPDPSWQALLMQAHAETGNAGEAVRMAEQVAAAKPDDKRAQLNLAAVYQQADMADKATAVLERLRESGKLDQASEYQQLYATYANIEGREQDTIAVIEEGLAKGVLKPDFNTQIALAQANYFSGNVDAGIAAYQKAAPLDSDGSTYLNLAKILLNEGRTAEAKTAAQKAKAKGLTDPQAAEAILGRAGG
ncbi:tetratricopeptide repeat protein [Novilysobacter spongiicola]|uniref:Tetratricopeptide repeat-containing protein n=1 Tax=Lysobacter spongiicola DSM 21749 TaxID=1122188 RepID=A0A1T4Q0Z5_9GAMM|nr:tetratricopeptide repeat protein [Lysobacter spongiicola]SJZ97191.1 Tetratricopeptide repeat-containing protein [Lysobacter spongiicola DSM 21749]